MSDTPRDARSTALDHVESLIRRGRELDEQLSRQAVAIVDVNQLREWQQQCAAAITHLSGGSKAHWLSRAFSDAFLVRSNDGGALVEAPAQDILRRLVDVLAQARASLLQMDDSPTPFPFAVESNSASMDSSRDEQQAPQRFAFVHRRELQPVLERAYADSRAALDRGEFGVALVLTCTVLESILTDALEHASLHGAAAAAPAPSAAEIADMPFEARIAATERAGLIRGGCARLPPVAVRYRDFLDDSGALDDDVIVLARDARTAAQVRRVVIRDLDPGR
jgi:hypothetical protein